MRTVITSFGSSGDFIPFCALAATLESKGHQATIAGPPQFAPLIKRMGLDFVACGPDIALQHRAVLRGQLSRTTSKSELRSLFEEIGRATPQAYSDLARLCDDADLLICSTELPLGLVLHETLGIPFVSVQITYPDEFLDYEREVRIAINRFRALLRLRPMTARNPYGLLGISPQLMLFALSSRILPPDPTWPAHFHVTGFLFYDGRDWEPDPALAAFLAAGPPPIVLTFGSMIHSDPDTVGTLILAAVARVGCRAIIQAGWSGLLRGQTLPPNVYLVDFLPHDQLLSQAGCVVHHGGTGTSAAVLRAGVPAVVVPHLFDQFSMAARAHALGCAPAPLPFHDLSVEGLSAAITEALTHEQYRVVAHALSSTICAEEGNERAIALIEGLMSQLARQEERRAGGRRVQSARISRYLTRQHHARLVRE